MLEKNEAIKVMAELYEKLNNDKLESVNIHFMEYQDNTSSINIEFIYKSS